MIRMLEFDEEATVRSLRALPAGGALAFAVAAAARQLAGYEKYARSIGEENPRRAAEIVDRLWKLVAARDFDRGEWRAKLDDVMSQIPSEDDTAGDDAAFADDALSSLAYAIRCLLSLDAQESAWSARRAYEAADRAAIRRLGIELDVPGVEATIRSHAIVQRELERQQRDLVLLRAGEIAAVRVCAASEALLTEAERASVELRVAASRE
jgi:uncharacterized protein YjaG (DUF416 family)